MVSSENGVELCSVVTWASCGEGSVNVLQADPVRSASALVLDAQLRRAQTNLGCISVTEGYHRSAVSEWLHYRSGWELGIALTEQ